MFKKDVERIIACIKHEDFYSAMEYAIFIKDKYNNKEKEYFENIIKSVKSGDFNKIWDFRQVSTCIFYIICYTI